VEKKQKLKVLIVNAQNGDQDSVVNLVHRFIPTVKKYSRRMGYEEAYADLIAWMVNAVHKYKSVHDTNMTLPEQYLFYSKTAKNKIL